MAAGQFFFPFISPKKFQKSTEKKKKKTEDWPERSLAFRIFSSWVNMSVGKRVYVFSLRHSTWISFLFNSNELKTEKLFYKNETEGNSEEIRRLMTAN